MAKYTSGRQKNLKVGLSSYSENLTSLEIVGKVGIGTTNATSSLHVFGDEYVTGVITATTFYGTFSGNSSTATYATSAGIATYATNAGIATYATSAGIATYATSAGIATYATSAGIATYATSAGIATYATSSGIATYATNAGIATYATSSGIATYATNAGIATYATRLQNARTFEITGDVVASAISFDGTGNVSLAATIQPNSVALGSDTTGDYVQSISGTSNQITVTGGTGEGSTPTLSIPSQFTAPQDVTVTRDLQVNRNLNVNGNITIGGTSAIIYATELKVSDPDIILGIRTDGSGNDVSNDTTANHGGIAIASTEGSPLVSLYNPGIGESTSATYKKIMWFKQGSFAGLGTDAWLINYGVGIGSTQVPNGVRLAAGGMQVTDTTLSTPQLSVSGLSTFTDGPVFIGAATSTGTASQPLQVTGGAYIRDSVGIGTTNPQSQLHITGQFQSTQANSTTTGGGQIYLNGATGNRIDFTNVGLAVPSFTTRSVGTKIVLYPTSSPTTSVDYAFGVASNTLWSSVNDSGASFKWYAATTNIATLQGTGELLLGTTSATGTASQPLQVNGSAYIAGDSNFAGLGIGITNNTIYPVDIRLSSGTATAMMRFSPSTGTRAAGILYGNTGSSNMWTGLLNSAGNGQNLSGLTPYAGVVGLTAGTTPLLLVTNALERVRVSDTGLVGIGTTNPTSTLTVQGDARVSGVVTASSFSGNASITQLSVSGVSTVGVLTATSIGIGTTNPTVSLWVGGSGYFIGSVSSANGFYVNGSLIGTGSISGDSIVGTSLSISGISTLGTVKISSGIITATTGVVTYYGDGRYLQGVVGFAVSLQDPVSTPVYPMFANNTGVTTSGISTTQLVFIPSSGNLGLGTTNPGSKLTVQGDVKVSGVVTATTFYGSAAGLTDIPPAPGSINITDTSTNATYYPTFAVGAGNTTSLKVTTTKFTFNPSTSVLTVKGNPYFGDTISSITLTNPLAVFTSNVDGYSQVQAQNLFAGGSSSASADFVGTTDSGTDTAEYINMGINNSGFTASGLWSAKDGYLFVQSPTSGNGGNLVVGTSGASGRDIIFHTGGTATTNERMRIQDADIKIQDNVEVISGSIYGKMLAASYGMFMP